MCLHSVALDTLYNLNDKCEAPHNNKLLNYILTNYKYVSSSLREIIKGPGLVATMVEVLGYRRIPIKQPKAKSQPNFPLVKFSETIKSYSISVKLNSSDIYEIFLVLVPYRQNHMKAT